MIEAMLKTGKYRFVCFGGAIKHENYNPVKTEEFGDDFIVYPVDGYGNPDMVRSLIRKERPDMLWFMTDPRFWGWLWEIEDEIRPLMPMVYYHVWDNYPFPRYNKPHYMSCDVIATISEVTDDIVKTVAPEVESFYVPHAVNTNIFSKIGDADMRAFKQEFFKEEEGKFVFFWNNRNARRKQSGSLLFWFKEFLDKVGHDKAMLLMHTDTKDPNGQDLEIIVRELELDQGQVKFSTAKLPATSMSMLYNAADCTISVSDAEGFGLATLESLACATPIIATKTGGLQQQLTDGERQFGISLEPASRAVIGSQEIPYIYEDRLNKDDVINALVSMYEMPKEERQKMGDDARQHVLEKYSLEVYAKRWEEVLDHIIEKHGSWETRKNYSHWSLGEVK
jgi:glycosyltransferase involved in cell wall biosynthesis